MTPSHFSTGVYKKLTVELGAEVLEREQGPEAGEPFLTCAGNILLALMFPEDAFADAERTIAREF